MSRSWAAWSPRRHGGRRTGRAATRLLAIVGLAAAFALLVPVGAGASPSITEFPIPTPGAFPEGITVGSDGALWFAETDASKIGRVTTAGAVTEFPLPGASRSDDITSGPDGALWFTEFFANRIGRISTSGRVTEYDLPNATPESRPVSITSGADGALWFTEGGQPSGAGRIGRITTAGVIEEFPVPTPGNFPFGIVGGPDGALWFTEAGPANRIGRITTGGTFSEFPLPGPERTPSGITVGPDRALWFSEIAGNRIGRVTTSGAVTEFPPLPTPVSEPDAITTGADGALWFTEHHDSVSKIGRMTTNGSLSELVVPTPNADPHGIVQGPDRAIWFTEFGPSKIGRITTDGTPPTCAQTIGGDDGFRRFRLTARDAGSGLRSIRAARALDSAIRIPAFTPGTTMPLVATATRIDASRPLSLEWSITDVAGNTAACRSDLVTLGHGRYRSAAVVTVDGTEHVVTVRADRSGAAVVEISVNGVRFRVRSHTRHDSSIDIATALRPGRTNRVALSARGSRFGRTDVLIWDGKGAVGG